MAGNATQSKPLRNDVETREFSKTAFIKLVHHASGGPSPADGANTQTKYLASYLDSLGAKTLVCERHYIDRHFMEEVSLYYSRCFNQPPNYTSRIHIFAEAFDAAKLDQILKLAIKKGPEHAATQLQPSYCGYIVVRPLPSVPIGRTVLKHLDQEGSRRFPTAYRYPIHFLGLTLEVQGLAFQQQDRAVAACATTAIWCALQRVCRRDGARPPTSSQITAAAVRNFLPVGRPFPSSGLTVEQICEALRSFEFPPDLFTVSGYPKRFLALLQIYLRSGIPVILSLDTVPPSQEGHAITVVGYGNKTSGTVKEKIHGVPIRLLNFEIDRLYVHDDRIGPYAKAELSTAPILDPDGEPTHDPDGEPFECLKLILTVPDGGKDETAVVNGAAPLYLKLRSSAAELLETAASTVPLINELFCDATDELGVEVFFERSGDYQNDIYRKDVNPERLCSFQKRIALSRYIGVIRWYSGDQQLIDMLWDTTDTFRETKWTESLLAVVAFKRKHFSIVDDLCKYFQVVSG